VIGVFADDHPGQQPRCSQAAVNDCSRDRGGRNGVAGAAGVLRANVAEDEEFGGLDVELLADILADHHQVFAALAAGAGFRLMADFDARQGLGQRLAAGAFATGDGLEFGDDLFGFRFAGGDVGFQGFLEQVALFGVQRFALGAEANAAQVGEFQVSAWILASACLSVASRAASAAFSRRVSAACCWSWSSSA
jgi:hypothetical protein